MTEKTSLGLEENVEAALCYLVGWVTGLIFLLIENDNKIVKFHAMQSLITFLPLTVAIWILGMIPFLGWIFANFIGILTFILWIILMIKAFQGEKFKIPVVGDIAEQNI
ncbi:MAG: DUF4870 domain-containing protein [Candidatus Thermoplasmatota archaeon]